MLPSNNSDIVDLLVDIARRVPDVIVIGGIACQAHGSSRLTEDLDLLPSLEPESWQKTMRALKDLGFRPRGELTWSHLLNGPDKVLRFLRLKDDRMNIRFVHDKTGIQVDLLVGYGERYAHYAVTAVRPKIDGVTVQVAAIDDLIALKREAAEIPSRRAKDLLDIQTLEDIRRKKRA